MLRIRRMTGADVPLGMRLKEEAGWNQTEADWCRFLDLEPDGCFVAEIDGTPAATTTTCILGAAACVALVLVDERLRGRGIGTALMQHALAYLDGHGVRSVRLDATPLGRPIYEKLGFVAEYELARFVGTLPECQMAPPSGRCVEPARPEHLEALGALDRGITGIDRGKVLRRFHEERPDAFRVVCSRGEIQGYLTSRPGSRATQLGPCAAQAGAGPLLLADAWRRHVGQAVFLDVPLGNRPALTLAESMGLTVPRRLLRMCRGEALHDCVANYWAGSGPEKG